MAGIFIQEWLHDLGIPAYVRPMAFGALIRLLKNRGDFACFVLGYGRLSQDPGYLRSFFHSTMDRTQGWNLSGYKNAVFDRLADASEEALDIKERQRLVRRMQALLMKDLPYLPLYNPLLLEAVRTGDFKGWVPMVGGIGNLWSFCTVRPLERAKK
jgi:ABC-type transport system substrate-binding protein